ncbi:MAG: flagellar hook-basal body complex protein FliE [Deltaproteobacteria bacterium]|jgi:flagellar hook-basal body complex protein FliE|nr:flagellar hook-basal body complex protein FliE [Deltaproteobacteria bacterium]
MTAVHLAPVAQSPAQIRPLADGGMALERGVGGADAVPFADWLRDALTTHETHAASAQRAGEAFAAGSLDDIHGTMIALKEADIELRVIANVRNKMLDAFNDLMRMSV